MEAPRRKPGVNPGGLMFTARTFACGRILPLLAHGGFYSSNTRGVLFDKARAPSLLIAP